MYGMVLGTERIKMELSTLLEIAALIVSFSIGCAGLIVNAFIQRKNNSIRIVTEKRVERRSMTQAYMADIIHCSDLKYIDSLTSSEKKQVIFKLSNACACIRSMYTYTYARDIELCESANQLEECVIAYINNVEQGVEFLRDAIEAQKAEFIKNADIYIQTDWSRIKTEAEGKKKNKKNRDKFGEAYQKYVLNYGRK